MGAAGRGLLQSVMNDSRIWRLVAYSRVQVVGFGYARLPYAAGVQNVVSPGCADAAKNMHLASVAEPMTAESAVGMGSACRTGIQPRQFASPSGAQRNDGR